jgi:hypothetical protein
VSDTLRVRNWDKWQSYRKDRGLPPWIKIHRCVMRNREWVTLTDTQRGQLVALWLLAADRDGAIPNDARVIRRLCHMTTTPNLNLFISLGFLEILASERRQPDAKPTPVRRQRDAPDTEAETEKNAATAAALEFDEWYRIYPRREARGSAERAYRTARKSTDQTILLAAAKRSAEKYRGADPKFIPLPATWLNAKRWLDEDTRPVQRALEGIV